MIETQIEEPVGVMFSQGVKIPLCRASWCRQMSTYRPWKNNKRISAKMKGPAMPLPDVRGEVLFGIHPVTAALKVSRRQSYMAFFKAGVVNPRLATIKEMCLYRQIDTLNVTGDVLDELSGNHPHQGVCLDVSPLHLPVISTDTDIHRSTLSDDAGRPAVWMLPWRLVDTMNMGAVLRTACFFGVQSVLLPSHYSSSLNAVVSKASAGALETMDIRTTKNSSHLQQCLQRWKDEGGQVVGSVCDADDSRCMGVEEVITDRPTMVVIGNEASGIPGAVEDMCDTLVYIRGDHGSRDMTTPHPDSLNVSVATGILLHSIMSSRREKG